MLRPLGILLVFSALSACSAAPGPRAEPDPAQGQPELRFDQRLADHVADIVKIIRDAGGNCGVALRTSLDYIDRHRASIDRSAQRVRETEERLSASEREEFRSQFMGQVEELVGRPQAIMKPFDEKCPVENKKIGKALGLDK